MIYVRFGGERNLCGLFAFCLANNKKSFPGLLLHQMASSSELVWTFVDKLKYRIVHNFRRNFLFFRLSKVAMTRLVLKNTLLHPSTMTYGEFDSRFVGGKTLSSIFLLFHDMWHCAWNWAYHNSRWIIYTCREKSLHSASRHTWVNV